MLYRDEQRPNTSFDLDMDGPILSVIRDLLSQTAPIRFWLEESGCPRGAPERSQRPDRDP